MCLQKLCRTCLSSTGIMYSLFDVELMGFRCAAEIVEKLISVPISNKDNMPNHICVFCFCEIQRSYTFKLKCEKSQKILNQLKEVKVNVKKLKDTPNQHEFESESNCKLTVKEEPDEILDLYDYDYDDIIIQDNAITSALKLNQISPNHQFAEIPLESMNFKTEPELNIQDIDCYENEPKAELKCPTCEKECETLEFFFGHIVTDHIEEKLCTLCNEEFDCSEVEHSVKHLPSSYLNKTNHGKELEQAGNLKKQIEKIHRIEQHCQHCSRHFTNLEMFRLHVCPETSANQNDKDIEMVQAHTTLPFICEDSLPGQSSDSLVKTNKSPNAQSKIQCTVCSKMIDKSNLNKHMRIHTELQCKLCSKQFLVRKLLDFHMEMKHLKDEPGRKPKFQCNVCSKISGCSADLKRHMLRHTGEKPFSCQYCSQKFRHRHSLVVHIEKKHANTLPDSKPKYQCEICLHISGYRGALVKHLRTHRRNNLLQCEFCFVKYRNSKALITHLETRHSNDSPSDGPKYQCSFCSKMFKNNSDLIIHVLIHTDETLFECKLCGEKFRHNRSLMIHLETNHSKDLHTDKSNLNVLFQCEFCSVKYQHSKSFIIHMETKHSNDLSTDLKKYQCSFCSEMFKHNIDLIRHVCSRIDKKKFQCKLCSEKFRHNQSWVIHMDTKHKKMVTAVETNYECSVCAENFVDNNDLISHMRNHKHDKWFQCEFCSQKYRNSIMLITHMETKHSSDLPNDEPKYQCNFCSKIYKHSRNLVFHMRTHTYDNLFECELCSKQCGSNQSLVKHMETKHSNDLPADGPKYHCNDCSKVFHYNCELISHMRIHTNSSPFKCKFCSEQFRLDQSLVVHMESKHPTKLSSVEPNYQCAICSKVFKNVRDLVGHMPSHTDKKLQCEMCSEQFENNELLGTHMQTKHPKKLPADEPKVECSVCLKKFNSDSDMNSHMQTHIVKVFQCKLCSEQFQNNQSLDIHMKTNHSNGKIEVKKCRVCSKMFSSNDTHLLKCVDEKPFQCEFCPDKFRQKISMLAHMGIKHKNLLAADEQNYQCNM